MLQVLDVEILNQILINIEFTDQVRRGRKPGGPIGRRQSLCRRRQRQGKVHSWSRKIVL